MNARTTQEINITENQAGGQKGKATSDHILLLKETICEIIWREINSVQGLPWHHQSIRQSLAWSYNVCDKQRRTNVTGMGNHRKNERRYHRYNYDEIRHEPPDETTIHGPADQTPGESHFQGQNYDARHKNYFRGKYENPTCRACKHAPDTQQHILEKCQSIHINDEYLVKKEDVFGTEKTELGKTEKNRQIL